MITYCLDATHQLVKARRKHLLPIFHTYIDTFRATYVLFLGLQPFPSHDVAVPLKSARIVRMGCLQSNPGSCVFMVLRTCS